MIDWLKARLSEGNSRRALCYLIAFATFTHWINPEDIGLSVQGVTQALLLMQALDGFATRQERREPPC